MDEPAREAPSEGPPSAIQRTRLRVHRYKVIAGVKLFREDVDSIIEVLGSGSEGVKVQDEEYEYPSILELEAARGHDIPKLTLISLQPYVSVRINRLSVTISTEGDERALGTFRQLVELVEQRASILRNNYPFLVASLFWTLVYYAAAAKLAAPTWLFITLAIVGTAVSSLFLRLPFWRRTEVDLRPKHKAPHFFARNKDELLREALIGLVTFVLGILVTLWWKA